MGADRRGRVHGPCVLVSRRTCLQEWKSRNIGSQTAPRPPKHFLRIQQDQTLRGILITPVATTTCSRATTIPVIVDTSTMKCMYRRYVS